METRPEQDDDRQPLKREAQSIWNENAEFWDAHMGEGNDFQRVLIAPAAERLLALQPGELVLDAACGNGVFARRMAQLGAQVVACDFSARFIELARQRASEYASRIEYAVIDATNHAELLNLGNTPLGPRRFDAAYCGMAIQDMVEIEPLFSALNSLLKPGGRFVFSIPHPAFNSSYIRKSVEEQDREGELVVQHAIKVTGYLTPFTNKGLGIEGQPAPHYYFHRPISQVYQTAFRHGFVLDGIEEPGFPVDAPARGTFSWENFTDIPPLLISRMRLVNPTQG